jgi:5,10-methylenetetrahydromethanopterin reductase
VLAWLAVVGRLPARCPSGGDVRVGSPDSCGVYFQDDYSLPETVELVGFAEECGFTTAWQSEVRLARESTVPVAAYLGRTNTMRVGTGVLNNWTRNPVTLACTFATLDELAPGRVMLGIGAWYEPIAGKVGVHRRRPLVAMRETVGVIRRLLAGESVSFEGEFVQLDDVHLDVVHGVDRPRKIPILIGASYMKMMEVAGEIADGVLLNYLVPPEYNDTALEHLEIGATRAGRSLDDVERPQLILTSVSHVREESLRSAKLMLARYLRQAEHIAEISRAPRWLVEKIHELVSWPARQDEVERAADVIPDEYVQGIMAVGAPEDARAAVRRYVEHGCTHPVLYPLGDPRLVIETFRDWGSHNRAEPVASTGSQSG